MPDFDKREDLIFTYDRWDIGNTPDLFLDVLENLKKKIKLVIGGFWHPLSLKDIFLTEVKKRGLQDQIDVIGPLGESQIYDLCSKAILHIHHNFEAFGMQTLEAASCGCPIIIPAGSGVADIFEHGVHGFFPENNNLRQLTEYTDRIISNKDLAKRMSEACWQRSQKYTWDNFVLQLEKIIRKYT